MLLLSARERSEGQTESALKFILEGFEKTSTQGPVAQW